MDTDPSTPVQSEGQGGGSSSNPIYAEYLDRIQDPEARGIAEEGFKAFDASATKRFTEAASYKRGWEPYEELGLRDVDPQTVQWAMQLAQAAQADPQQFYEWVNGDYAQQYGIQAQQPQEYGDWQDPSEQQNQELIQRLDRLEQMFQDVNNRFEEQGMQGAQQEAMRMIEGQFAELQKEHGDAFNREAVEMLLPHFTEQAQTAEDLQQVVPRAWQALQGLLNKNEQQAFSGKLNAPPAPEGSGMPNVVPKQAHTLKEAHAMAMDIARRGGL